MMRDESKYSIYILRLPDNRLYVGMSKNPGKRFLYHKKSKGAKFTRYSKGPKLVYTEEFSDMVSAMRRERQVKGWTRAKKEALIARDRDLLKSL
ncbi:MAG: GIY-YIG nuclease family protein [Candidatus Berkelbacteria bacterium]|nr:GIY-YIG nuclease family protein [Candidatus Berkelbacteria bacterium]